MKKLLQRIVVLGCIGLVVAAGGIWYILRSSEDFFASKLALEQATEYQVMPGDGIAATIDAFAQAQWIATPPLGPILQLLLRYHKLNFSIQRGTYSFAPGITLRQALERLRDGVTVQRRWVLIEGRTLIQALPDLANNPHIEYDLPPVATYDDYPALAQKIGLNNNHPEGLFLADTYFFIQGEKASSLLKRAHTSLMELQDTLNESCDSGPLSEPLTPHQRAILASIIEKETGQDRERPQIAAVFLNRLARGMRLQTDPTVIYGLGKAYQGNITKKHLRTPTPYNTYTIAGLPPTPIGFFGEAALTATCQPDKDFIDQNMLFFVGKGDGSHHFSATYQEHRQAVARYQLNPVKNYRSAPQ